MADLDLNKWGLSAWLDPRQAQQQAASDAQNLLSALIAYRLQLQRERATCPRAKRRDLERELDDTYKTASMLMSLLRTERELSR